MRPVTKGAKGTYPYDVDVSSQANLDTSLGLINIPFGSTATAKAIGVWGTASPTASQVLDGLLLVAKDDGSPPAKKKAKKAKGVITVADIKVIKGTLDTKLATMYGAAGGPLQEQLGRFCSFCEMYILTAVAVEHVTPKAPYPLFYIAWDNFLLACPICNSCKLSKPPRDDALFAVPPTDEVGYFTTIRDNYLWPDLHTYTYRNTKPVLEYYTQGNWWEVDYPVDLGTGLRSRGQLTRQPKADVRSDVTTKKGVNVPTWHSDVPVRVRVAQGGPLSTNMVENLVNLNKPSSNDKKPGGEADIRMWTRTVQWFKVLNSLRRLKNATAGNFDDLWDSMLDSVQQPGLYSVWVTVLDLLGPGGSWKVPGTTTSVMSKFLTTITGEEYFPGTDTDNTP